MRASKSGGGGRLGKGARGAEREEGEKELLRKKTVAEVQEMKTAYRTDGQMKTGKEKP